MFKNNSKSKFQEVFQIAKEYIRKGKVPCAVLGLIDINKNSYISASGFKQIIPSKKIVNKNTIFDLASLTKVLFTTHQILKASSSGILDLDLPISKYVPDLCQYDYHSWERYVTLKQCLTHSTLFPAVEPIYTFGENPNTLKNYLLQKRWSKNKKVYSDINFILLGIVLERLTGIHIKDINTGYKFTFRPTKKNIASTEKCFWRNRIICGDVHDENSYALDGAGHAGLFGSVESILEFAYDMLKGNKITKTHQNLIKTKVYKNRSYGWEVSNKGWSGGNKCSKQTIGHTGFTGTGVWIDFKNGLAWTLLTNRVHPSRHVDSKIDEIRVKIGNKIIELFGNLK